MRLDHIAFRVKDRDKAATFLSHQFSYRVQDEFEIPFDDGSTAICYAMVPPENVITTREESANVQQRRTVIHSVENGISLSSYYHLAPEVFVSQGSTGSIVDQWVQNRGGIGGIHHMAYEHSDVAMLMSYWRGKGYEFTTENPITCPDDDLVQAFTKPIEVMGGMIYEFIQRGDKGFCGPSVRELMESTRDAL